MAIGLFPCQLGHLTIALAIADREPDWPKYGRGDRDFFIALLENPPKPNATLRKAFAEHKKRHG